MSHYSIISFCNMPSKSQSPVLLVKFSSNFERVENFSPIFLGFKNPILQVTGLTICGENLFVIFVSIEKISYISSLSLIDFSLNFCQELSNIVDPHSIIIENEKIFIVSTGTDEIVTYDISHTKLINEKILWKASDTKLDTHHVNSIASNNNEILISAFGKKNDQFWSSAKNGYIYNITKDQYVIEGIYHPHSLAVLDNNLYYCESYKGSLISEKGYVLKLDGYARGIASPKKNILCIGTSLGRKVSKSTGLIGQSNESGDLIGFCRVTFFDKNSRNIITMHNFSWFGPEIYDIVFFEPSKDYNELDYSSFFKNSFLIARENSKTLMEENERKDIQIVQTKNTIHEIYNSESWKIARFFANVFHIIKKFLSSPQ